MESETGRQVTPWASRNWSQSFLGPSPEGSLTGFTSGGVAHSLQVVPSWETRAAKIALRRFCAETSTATSLDRVELAPPASVTLQRQRMASSTAAASAAWPASLG